MRRRCRADEVYARKENGLADTTRTIHWQSLWWPGTERCSLIEREDGWRMVGTALLTVETQPFRIDYRISLDRGWATRAVEIAVLPGDGSAPRRLLLSVDPDGRWGLRREPDGGTDADDQPALRGLVDVDLGFTPATNTLPIRRLHPEVGATVEVTATWLRFPELTVAPLTQRYTRLDEYRYRYESGGGAFVTEIEVDDLGLVVEYMDGWRRIAATSLEG
jgi:hypothetical protein